MSELLYSPATYGVDFSSKTMLKPRARQAPMMAVVKNALWLMGGIVEVDEVALLQSLEASRGSLLSYR